MPSIVTNCFMYICQTAPQIYIFCCIHHTIQLQDLFYYMSLRVLHKDTDPLTKFLGVRYCNSPMLLKALPII